MSLWSKVKNWFGGNEEPPPKVIPPEPLREPERQEAPERSEASREPRDRSYWLDRAVSRKEEIWGDTGRYNARRAELNTARGVDGHRPSVELLKWAATTDEANLHLMIASGDKDYSFLYYK